MPLIMPSPFNISAPIIKTLSRSETGADSMRNVRVAPSGNFYVVGQIWAGVTKLQQVFIAAYDPNFNLRWEKMAGNGTDLSTDMAIDSSENVYVLGYTGTPHWVVKYDLNGNTVFNREFAPASGTQMQPFACDTDSSGDLYIAGRSAPILGNDGAMCKIDGTGNIVWDQLYHNVATTDWLSGMASDGTDIYVSGGGNSGYFVVAKMLANGSLVWQRQLNDTGVEVGQRVNVDSSGNVYSVGYSNSSSAGGTVGVNSLILAKWDNTGSLQWQRSLTSGSGGDDRGNSVTTDSIGNVYVVGQTDNGGSGRTDLLVAKFDSSGNLTWQRTFNAASGSPTGNVLGYGIKIHGNLMTISGETFINAADGLVMRFPVNGAMTGIYGDYSWQAGTLTAHTSTIPESAGPNTITTPPSGGYTGFVLQAGTPVIEPSLIIETIVA